MFFICLDRIGEEKGYTDMATMKLTLSNISRMSPAGRSNTDAIVVECDMSSQDMEDAICQMCDSMGDEALLECVQRIIPFRPTAVEGETDSCCVG